MYLFLYCYSLGITQKQIAQGIKFGQRPSSMRRSEGDEGSSDEEEVPRSPLKVLAQVETEPPKTEPKVTTHHYLDDSILPFLTNILSTPGAHSTPAKSPRSKRVLPSTGTIESVNLDAVPQSVPRLDNTAAKHKLSIKPKNQRVSRKHRRFTQVRYAPQQTGLSMLAIRHDISPTIFLWRRELEEQRLRQEEEERRKRAEEIRLRELEEEKERCCKQREEEERKRQEEEERMKREEEERKKEEEGRRIREAAERRRQEEEERMKREEEERKKEEEGRRIREAAERRRQEEEERMKREEEERRKQEEERLQEEEQKRREEEKERRQRKEEEEARKREEFEAERMRKLKEEEEEKQKQEEAEKLRLQVMEQQMELEKEEQMRKVEKMIMSEEEADGSSDPHERKRRAEELRWREMEERQKPFSFKVSSGEKQILFQKVNLMPVMPASSHQSSTAAEQRKGAKAPSTEGPESPNLPASPYVPHTAILVTGAQLCGTAVNLDQIKDTACKSLLGLGEDRKAQGTPPPKSKTSPDRKSGKTKSLNESAFSTDQSSADVLAEWASIRSKIFKGVEEGKYDEYPETNRNQPHPPSNEDQPAFSHSNLRKTMSANAKFSITPAKKKFGDSNRNSEVFGVDDKEAGEEAPTCGSPSAASPTPTSKPLNRTSKNVRIVEKGSEECMFAKDLPSFLVPSPGAKPDGAEVKSRTQSEVEAPDSRDEAEQVDDSEDKPSPFGIKLRRTNYSLRFHSEQSTEKRKKRYSAGDSFDGVPSPLTPIEPDSDASSVFSDRSSPASPQKEGVVCKYLHACTAPAVPRAKPVKSASPTAHSEGEKVHSKPPLYRRPTTSPKPTGAVPTPPPSPLPKAVHGSPSDIVIQRTGAKDSSSQEQTGRSEQPSIITCSSAEKPSLQSRHSLDSARVQEKEAGPLWITLALQKQKGFREQQQNREERRSQREVKLAEKHTRERESVCSKGSGSISSLSKPQAPEEPKRPESLLGRLERRDHLKKANTLPSSVTVEIADSTPSPPAVKEVSKRFPSSDSPQVSTEPAWLALAKRKAKAWSDCPQIIK
uniref:Capping protein inhibiting regulator of actin dynamics n=1 Tax=Echeneis naucrates TaxID=173247 RepID=A0A665VAA6_ECHNA